MQATVRDGLRCDAATASFGPVWDRHNLSIVKNALVTRLLVEKGRAIGVAYLGNRQSPRTGVRMPRSCSLPGQ
jgi:choline dehydrogenase